jgi:hypothetical protein
MPVDEEVPERRQRRLPAVSLFKIDKEKKEQLCTKYETMRPRKRDREKEDDEEVPERGNEITRF